VKTIDARGLSCPRPVILAQNAIRTGEFPIEIWVDSAAARENVSRAAQKAGLHVSVQELGAEYRLTLSR
jgi:TusA-related sulfurtransferase